MGRIPGSILPLGVPVPPPHQAEPCPHSRLPRPHLGQAARWSQIQGRAGDGILTRPRASSPEQCPTPWTAVFTAPEGVHLFHTLLLGGNHGSSPLQRREPEGHVIPKPHSLPPRLWGAPNQAVSDWQVQNCHLCFALNSGENKGRKPYSGERGRGRGAAPCKCIF